MSGYADIYVIKKTRSKEFALSFLDHFAPQRRESAENYLIPQYSNEPTYEFTNASALMTFLEPSESFSQSIYWSNLDTESPNRHVMLFYTEDGFLIFGISRHYKSADDTRSEEECLQLMTEFLETNEGYITYECPPENTHPEFILKVHN